MIPVSVLIPAFRAGATLDQALVSVAEQTAAPHEVVLVDDGSDDDTLERMGELTGRGWPFAMKVVRLPENVGPGEARNAGWAAADPMCEFVAFLDVDDVWMPQKLERQIGWMRRNPEFPWTAHRYLRGGEAAAQERRGHSELTRNRLLFSNRAATSTVVAHRDLALRFRSGWRYCEDLMLWLDWLDAGMRGALLQAELARRYVASGGLTSDLRSMHAGELRVVETLRTERRISTRAAATWRLYMQAKYVRRNVRT